MLVAAANLAARAEGVRPEMRLTEANALTDGEVLEHDPHEDLDALCALAEQAQRFSPIVGLEQLDKKLWFGRTLAQPECLTMDISGLAAHFGGEEPLVGKIADWLGQQHYFGCIGIADSLGSAWGIANYATRGRPNTPSTQKASSATQKASSDTSVVAPTSSKPASHSRFSVSPSTVDTSILANTPNDSATPNRTTVPCCRFKIVPPSKNSKEVSQATADLPIAALRLPSETVTTLHRLGIRRIGQLATLPRDGLASRLGNDLIRRWDQLLGTQNEPIVTLHDAADWCLEQSLEFPTQNRQTIAELIRRLCHTLAERLQQQDKGALRLVCRLDLQDSQPMVMQLGLFRPNNDEEHLQLLLAGQLEQQLRHLNQSPLWRLSLQATLVAPMLWRQADLFDSGATESRQQIARFVDTLSSRLGRQQVVSVGTRRESQPELAFSAQPMTGRQRNGQEGDSLKKLSSRLARKRIEPSRDDPLRRPTHLLTPPSPIEVVMPADQTAPGHTLPSAMAPDKFKVHGSWHQVVTARGPERLESGWWRGPSARRDYYRIASQEGSWWWIYRDLNHGTWYLHGLFD